MRKRLLFTAFLLLFLIGCKDQMDQTRLDIKKSKEQTQKEQELQKQEYQALFQNKKWAVQAIDLHEDLDEYLIFSLLGERERFICDIFSIDVVLDKSLNGTYVEMIGVSRNVVASSKETFVDGVNLYVDTETNKKKWDDYIRSEQLRILASKSPREVNPPEKN